MPINPYYKTLPYEIEKLNQEIDYIQDIIKGILLELDVPNLNRDLIKQELKKCLDGRSSSSYFTSDF